MRLSELDYVLPAERIAQRPLERRDAARLLTLDRASGACQDRSFRELPDLLHGNELVVVNDARVIPARLFGHRAGVHAQRPARATRNEHLSGTVEVLVTKQLAPDVWNALVRPGRKMRTGERILFGDGELEAEIIGRGEFGSRTLRFASRDLQKVSEHIERLGHVPLPPYIDREDESADRERYQTIFAKNPGAIAAPTAGLHFTPEVIAAIRRRGAEICELTLNVGLGTFQPIHSDTLEKHHMHLESYEISEHVAARVANAHAAGRPILAVGTTVVRALEDAAIKAEPSGARGLPQSGRAEAELFIFPGFRFRVVTALLTNFHLPRSTLLALVCAFAGRERVLAAYRHAVDVGYRFYSYGDCMLIR
jgi:S-adenosylmethionine:tRNA ribosyltransferase-isomerase